MGDPSTVVRACRSATRYRCVTFTLRSKSHLSFSLSLSLHRIFYLSSSIFLLVSSSSSQTVSLSLSLSISISLLVKLSLKFTAWNIVPRYKALHVWSDSRVPEKLIAISTLHSFSQPLSLSLCLYLRVYFAQTHLIIRQKPRNESLSNTNSIITFRQTLIRDINLAKNQVSAAFVKLAERSSRL